MSLAPLLGMGFTISVASSGQTKRIDLTHLPVTQVDKGSRTGSLFLMIFAVLWGGIPTFMLVKAIQSGAMQAGLWGLLLFGIIGIGLFIGGLAGLVGSTTTTLSLERVSVTRKSLFGTRQWSEALTAFPGIRYRSEYHSGGENSPSYTLYIVELVHADPKKAVRLYEARAEVGVRGIWEDACRTLNRPAVEGEGASLVIRAVEDLNKSVKELAREGKLHVEIDLSRTPPAGLSLRVDGTVLEITIQARRYAGMAGALIGFVVSGVFVYVGFFIRGAPIFFGLLGSVIMLVVLASLVWMLITQEQIRLAKDELHLRRRTPWGPTTGIRISAASVETVRVGRKENQGGTGILVETDAGTTPLGVGLSSGCLEWLRNCILKVIAA